MKKILFLSVLLTILVVIPVVAYGATFKTGENYYLNSSETIKDNLYTASPNVNIAGAVNGDLFAAGGNVIVSGPISADLAAAGGTLNISGDVTGDMRLAGGNINIANYAGGELLVAGGQISIISGTVIGKDAKIAGGSINYEGNTGGNVVIRGDSVFINGAVGGDLSVKAREITLGPKALISGDLDYYSPKEAMIEPGATARGAINFHKTEMPAKKPAVAGFLFGILTFALIVKTLMFITASLVALYFAGNQVKSIVKEASSNFWKEAGRGFVILFIAPVAIIVSFVTVIGISLGLIALFIYLVFVFVAAIVSVLLFAQLALKYVFKKEDRLNWWVAVLAVLALGIINMIPVIGWIFTFIVFFAALGSSTSYIFRKLRE